ncbi:MAG: sulfatase-like hydrolase/transferase, partial [Lentisphaerae bacterium]|nr:sulfatase-like hydrolase/transferase [Lentisphaerota bacterium]
IEPHHQNDHRHYEGPRGSRERFRDFTVPGDLIDAQGDWREEYPDYLGCVNSLDQNLGRIRDALQAQGLADNTLIIYTSDHGSHFRTRNSEYKRSCHDGCIRVPLIIQGPGFESGQTFKELTSLIDLPPTILQATGLTPPPAMRGRALQELVAGRAGDWPGEGFVQISQSHCGRAIRTHKWKYSVRAPDPDASHAPSSDIYVEDFLYDLEADPHERNNLVHDPAFSAIRRELALTLKRRMRAADEAEPEIVSVPAES